jgi:His/Glu/Gln/Arg/opine family amino acid ABC transporter permease subunit
VNLEGFGPQLIQGTQVTLAVAIGAAVIGTALGVIFALIKLRGGRTGRRVAEAYTTVIRGVPDLLLIFVVYFGGTVTLSWILRQTIEVDSYTAGCVSLGVIFGAYATEIFRGAILAVPKGQIEAAQALGLTTRRTFTKVVLPQAWRLALPPYGNQLIVLTKQTSLVSIVGLEEIMRKANIGAGATNQPFTFYLAAAMLYLTLTATLSVALFAMERAAARGLARR